MTDQYEYRDIRIKSPWGYKLVEAYLLQGWTIYEQTATTIRLRVEIVKPVDLVRVSDDLVPGTGRIA